MQGLRIDRLFMATETRNDNSATTGERVRLFFDQTEVCQFDPPAPSGRTAISERAVSIPYSDFTAADTVSVGLTGDDPWGPRSILVWARLSHPGQVDDGPYAPCELAPLAYLQFEPGFPTLLEGVPWLSQDLDLGSDRLELIWLRHLKDHVDVRRVLIVLETMPDMLSVGQAVSEALQTTPQYLLFGNMFDQVESQLSKLEKVPYRLPVGAGSSGPIDVSMSTYDGGSILHTELADRGLQHPAVTGQAYLASFEPNLSRSAEDWFRCVIRNRSDDPWLLKRAFVFGLGNSGMWPVLGRVLFWQRWPRWLGQDCFVAEDVSPRESLRIHAPTSYVLDELA